MFFNFFKKPAVNQVNTNVSVGGSKPTASFKPLFGNPDVCISGKILKSNKCMTKGGLLYYMTILVIGSEDQYQVQLWDKAAAYSDKHLLVGDYITVEGSMIEWNNQIIIKVHKVPVKIGAKICIQGIIENTHNVRDPRKTADYHKFTIRSALSQRVYCALPKSSAKHIYIQKGRKVAIDGFLEEIGNRVLLTVSDIYWI